MNDPAAQFVKRTLEIVKTDHPKHDVSFLINCIFGLVVFPHTIVLENIDPNDHKGWGNKTTFWKQNLKQFENLPPVIHESLKNNNYFPKTIGEFLDKMRNAFCHQEFKTKNEEGKLVGISVLLVKNRGLRFDMKKDELREVVTFLALEYLNFLAPK